MALPAAVFLVSLLAPASARGSGREKPKPYALIFGTVWDPDGHPLYGIKVKIRRATDKANKARWELYSNHTGEFAQRLPAGTADYIVWADVKGVKLSSGKQLKPGAEVTVHIDNDERSDIGLHLDW
ncbi:MAG: carboxypeptidase-like regulatory domain-containing protein [Terriglobales bacterium]